MKDNAPMMNSPTLRGRRLAIAGIGASLGLGISHSARAATAPPPALRIAGPASGTGGLALLGQAYMRAHPGAQITVLAATGNAGGIQAVIDGHAEIAVSHRPPTLAERRRAALDVLPYSRTPFVLAVHRELGVERLSLAELAVLYREEAPAFRNGRRARPVLHLADSLDTELLRSMSPAVAAGLEQAAARCGLLDAATDAQAADFIERTPGAFGPTTLALIESDMRPLRPLVIEGFPTPTPEHVTSGRYPWSKPVLLVHAGEPTPAVQQFLDFACSGGARKLLAMAGHCTG
jgi:phosphate transport system substrate-binding protein